MRVNIIKIGNSRAIRIPTQLLERAGLAGAVELTLELGRLVIRPAQAKPRAGWAEALDRLLAAEGACQDSFADMQEPENAFDGEDWAWP